jgi:hypothetical protein
MSLPIISASQISTNEPEEVVIFNKWWIENLHVFSDQNINIRGLVTLAKFGTKNDGTMVFSGEKTNLVIDNVLAEAQENELLANIMGGIVQYVGQKVIQNGLASSVDLPETSESSE